MLRKLATASFLAIVPVSALLAVGCSPDRENRENRPYSLTGEDRTQADRDHQEWRERMQYTDDKGRYHPELAAQGRTLRPMPY